MRKLLAAIAVVALPELAAAADYGDRPVGSTVHFKFTTTASTGAAATLGGTPAVSVYKDNNTAETSTGVTLTPDFDSKTGLAHVAIDTAADGSFYSAGSCFDVVITTGTVNGVSFANYDVGSFCLEAHSALRPSVTGRELDVSAAGDADAQVKGIDADVITSAAIANDAIGGTELAAGAGAELGDAFLDRALSGHTTSGTAGEALSRLDVAVSTRAASGAAITLINAVSATKVLTVKQGDDYSATDSVPIDFAYTGAYDPTSPTSITLRIYTSDNTELAAWTGSVIGSSSPWTLRFQPTAAQTSAAALVPRGGYRYDVEVVKNGRKRTLVGGACTIEAN